MSTFENQTDQPTSLGEDATQAHRVKTERVGAVWLVTINRPDVRNAIDGPTARALTNAFQKFERTADLSVAVLTGAGGTFCSGIDLTAFPDEQRLLHLAEEGIAPLGLARLVPSKPCLAAIEGYALAGGFELALWCDLRVAASNAVFGLAHHRWGIPSLDGATVLLPRLVGQSHALDLILTGRNVTGEEAHVMGLVNHLAAPGTALQTALALAEDIARFPQSAVRADRLSCYEQWSLSYLEALQNEVRHSLPVIQSEKIGAALNLFRSRKEKI